MIVSTKAISSPGRTEKLLQPPLMLRFLRSNVGSKSGRSRSRASPMLFRSKKSTVIETNQEPSSPKVSCIGQVRARRSNPTGRSNRSRSNRRCWWFCRALLFSHRKLSRPRSLRRLRHVWRKWVLFFRFGYCKKVDIREEFLESNSNQERAQEVVGFEEDAREEFVAISSPPKNAFLLTRCRSAPYRSSSLACRFEEDEVKKKKEEEDDDEEEEERESVGPPPAPSHPWSSPRVDDDKEENDSRGKYGNSNGRNSGGGGTVNVRGRAEEEGGTGGGGGPLIVLTRCKSEPARTGEKLISIITQNKVGFC